MTTFFMASGIAILALEMWRLVAQRSGPSLTDRAEPEISDAVAASLPLVSFLVPAWNAADDIERFIVAFRALSLPRKELIMCVGGTDDGLVIARSHAGDGVFVIPQFAGEGKQRALQRSFEVCRGDIVYLTDVDCDVTDDSVYALLEPMLVQDAKVVTGEAGPWMAQMKVPLIRALAAMETATAPTKIQPSRGLRGCNSAVARDALEKIHGFQTEAPSGTDYTLAQELRRAGFTIWFIPGPPMRTRYATSTLRYIRQQRRWTRNVYVLGRRYGVESDVMGALKTFALALATAALCIAGFALWPAWILVLLLLTHATVNQLCYQRASGYRLTVVGGLHAFIANQVAAIWAITDLVVGRTPW